MHITKEKIYFALVIGSVFAVGQLFVVEYLAAAGVNGAK